LNEPSIGSNSSWTAAAGLEKLRNRQYHREPLTKALGDGLFELRHVGKLNTRVLWFFVKGRRIIAVHGIRNKGQATRPATLIGRCKNQGCQTWNTKSPKGRGRNESGE
jgi:Phage derived protein Gp49-like (DUF891)